MGQLILVNERLCMGLHIPEPGVGLQIYGTGVTEGQAPASKTYAHIWIRGIKTGDA